MIESKVSSGKNFELIDFKKGKDAPNALISPGAGGHYYVFAELGFLIMSEATTHS
jgi:hypothetical protein